MCRTRKVLVNMSLSKKGKTDIKSSPSAVDNLSLSEEEEYHTKITTECFKNEKIMSKDARCIDDPTWKSNEDGTNFNQLYSSIYWNIVARDK